MPWLDVQKSLQPCPCEPPRGPIAAVGGLYLKLIQAPLLCCSSNLVWCSIACGARHTAHSTTHLSGMNVIPVLGGMFIAGSLLLVAGGTSATHCKMPVPAHTCHTLNPRSSIQTPYPHSNRTCGLQVVLKGHFMDRESESLEGVDGLLIDCIFPNSPATNYTPNLSSHGNPTCGF